MKRFLLLAVAFICIFELSAQVQGTNDIYYKSPDLTLPDLEGVDHNLYDLLDDGKFVLIDLMTTWCSPCLTNLPFVETWYEEYGPAGTGEVEMWMVECDDNGTSLEDFQQYIADNGVTCCTFEENDYFWNLDEFPCTGYPSYFVICPDRSYHKVTGVAQQELADKLVELMGNCPDIGTYNNDVKVIAWEGPFNQGCSNPELSFTIENRGVDMLTEVTFELYVDGVLDIDYDWSGALEQYEVERVVLPALEGAYSPGGYNGELILTDPNGSADEYPEDNTEDFNFTLIDGDIVEIFGNFRYGAQSYSFEIVDEDDEVLISHTFSASSSYGTELYEACLEASKCYTFNISDVVTAPTGAGFQDPQEYIDISLDGEILVHIDHTNYSTQYGSFEFCTGTPIQADPPTDVQAEVTDFDVALSWTAPADMTPDSYTVYRDGTEIADNITTTSYLDEGLTPATYEYCVTAVYSDGESDDVCVEAVVETPSVGPILEINPDNLDVSLFCDPNTKTKVVELSNSGDETLSFTVEVIMDNKKSAKTYVAVPKNTNVNSADAEGNPSRNANATGITTDATYDLQFEFACGDASGEAGIETDGDYIYSTKWNGAVFFRYELDGTFLGDFACGSAAAVRDLAYDGTYFYGGAAATTIFQCDFDNETLVSTFTAPVATRAIAYNDDLNGFYGNNWSDDITLYSNTGAVLNQFPCGAMTSFYGFAWSNTANIGEKLWGFSQDGSGAVIVKMDATTGAQEETIDAFTVVTGLEAGDLGGGLFTHNGLVAGTWTLGGIIQNKSIFGLELESGTAPSGWLSTDLDPTMTYTIAAGESMDIEVTFDATTLENGDYSGSVEFTSNSTGTASTIECNLTYECNPTLEAPTNFEIVNEVWNAAGNMFETKMQWEHADCGKSFVEFIVFDENDVELGTTSSCDITISGIANMCYYVVASYDEGTTDPSNQDCSTSVNDIIDNAFSIYPNPAKNAVYISSPYAISRINVYNMVGQLVEDLNVTDGGTVMINTSSYESGLYLMKIEAGGVTSLQRFTVVD